MKKWMCFSCKDSAKISETIEEKEKDGWIFHSFTSTVYHDRYYAKSEHYDHHLLFFKE